MKKFLKTCSTSVLLAILALGVTSAKADYISDDYFIGELLFNGDTYGNEFDLTDDGLGPGGSYTAYSAGVAFTFLNIFGEIDEVKVELDSMDAGLTAAGGMFFALFGEVSGSIVATLNATGKLAYEISYTGDNAVYLKWGGIGVEVGKNAPTTSVPDGGSSLLLLGAGVLAAGIAARRRQRN